MLWNQVGFITHIYFLDLVVAGKLQALASWLARLIVNKGRLPIHAENANPALI
jgi:hypothetical protein